MNKRLPLLLAFCLSAFCTYAQHPADRKVPLEMLLNRDGSVQVPAGLNATVDTRGWDLRLRPDGSPAFSRSGQAFHQRQLQQSAAAPRTAAHPDDQYWDDQFSLRGVNGDVFVLKSYIGKIYIGGLFTTVGKTVARNVAVWDGSSWSSLGTGADNGVNADVQAIEIDGTDVYVGGSFSKAGSLTANKVAHWDGTAWHPLGTGTNNGVGGFYVTCLALKGPGQLFVGGSFSTAGTAAATNVALWDGSTWSAVGGGTDQTVWSMAYADNKLFIGGGFETVGTDSIRRVAYWDGSTWHGMGGANDWIMHISGGSIDELVFAGFFTEINGQRMNRVARYSLSNQTWSPLGAGGADNGANGPVRAVRYNFGTYYLAGSFDSVGTVPAKNVAIYNGGGFQAIGKGVSNVVRGIGLDGNTLIMGGSFVTAGDTVSYGLAKADFDPFDLTVPPVWSALTPGTHNGADGVIRKALIANGELYVAGTFDYLGTKAHHSVAKWDGNRWVELGTGIPAIVNDIVWFNNELYAGGYFAVQQGGIISPLIARWDGTQWLPVGQGIGGSVASQVFALETDGSSLYVAGMELTEAANPSGSVIQISNIARWDGSAWHALGAGIGAGALVYDLLWHQNKLYASGSISEAGGQPVNNLAVWDGSTWSTLGSGLSGTVFALAADNSKLYAGGDFATAGTVTVNNLAQWDGTAWSSVGNGVHMGGNSFNMPYVSALLPHQGGLYVGGFFDQVGQNQPMSGLGYYDGSTWHELGSGTGDGTVHSLVLHQNRLFATGTFYIVGEKGASAMAAFDNVVTGREEQAAAQLGFRCYPNPAAHVVQVTYSGSGTAQLTLSDLTGRTLRSLPVQSRQQLELSGLPAGLYQLTLRSGEVAATQKLVVQH